MAMLVCILKVALQSIMKKQLFGHNNWLLCLKSPGQPPRQLFHVVLTALPPHL